MPQVIKREAAKRDLIAQWVWYAENAGIETADRFLTAAEATATMLAGHPESGNTLLVAKAELRTMRRFPLTEGFDQVLLFYFPLSDGIELVRGRRDLKRLISEGFFG